MSNEHAIDRSAGGAYLIAPCIGHSATNTNVYSLTDEEAEAVALANKIIHDIGLKYTGVPVEVKHGGFVYVTRSLLAVVFPVSYSIIGDVSTIAKGLIPAKAVVTRVDEEAHLDRYKVHWELK